MSRSFEGLAWLLLAFVFIGLGACASPSANEVEVEEWVEVTLEPGSSFGAVTDTLESHGLVGQPRLFQAYARLRGDDRRVRAGTYRLPASARWSDLLDALVEGRIVTVSMTIPEGFTLQQIVPRIAAVTELEEAAVRGRVVGENRHEEWGVPGPGLEGYLFPDTYRFAPGVELDSLVHALVSRYQDFWSPERRNSAEKLGMSEGEVVTLASIVEAEARHASELEIIASVFHNRLRIGMPLQADPTVQYALGERQSRLLYTHIDEVADHPYNTYTQPGLPPGPIGAPGEAALLATLNPADTPYLYFVARPDGSHVFTRTLSEHNRARVQVRREWDALDTGTEPR